MASRGYSLVAVCRLLIVVASCCRAQALGHEGFLAVVRGLNSYGSQAQWLWHMDLAALWHMRSFWIRD